MSDAHLDALLLEVHSRIVRQLQLRASPHEDDVGLGRALVDGVASLGGALNRGAGQVWHVLAREGQNAGALAVLHSNLRARGGEEGSEWTIRRGLRRQEAAAFVQTWVIHHSSAALISGKEISSS